LKKKKEIGRERVGFCFSVKTENPSESALDFIFDFSLFSFLFNSSLIWFDAGSRTWTGYCLVPLS
jgi:hypothetical protein